MDQQPAKQDLSSLLSAEQSHPHASSGEHRAASGSLGSEESAARAVLSSALQQLASPTAARAAPQAPATQEAPPASASSSTATTAPTTPSPTATLSKAISPVCLDNQGQHRCVQGPYEIHCDVFNNQGGVFEIAGPVTLYYGKLLNQGGIIRALGGASLIGHALQNNSGQIISQGGSLTVTNDDRLQNQQGTLTAKFDLTLNNRGGLLDNRHGKLQTEAQLLIDSREIDNEGGYWQGNQGITGHCQALTGSSTLCSGDFLRLGPVVTKYPPR